jgi:hypothetical protein
MTYWIDAYRSQGLRNVLDSARLTNWTLAKVVRDKHYDAVTARIHAYGLDYTVDAADHVVGGSRTSARQYSEYWTLIRGAAVRGTPRADRSCPSCGAGLKVGMGGECEFCKKVITRGDFDWVLSTIEQDDVYRG